MRVCFFCVCFVLRKWFRANPNHSIVCHAAFAQQRFGCCAACSTPSTEAYHLLLTGKRRADVYKPKIGQRYRIPATVFQDADDSEGTMSGRFKDANDWREQFLYAKKVGGPV